MSALRDAFANALRPLLDAFTWPRHALLAALILAFGLLLAMLVDRGARRVIRRAGRLIASRGHEFAAPGSERLEAAVGRTLYVIVIVLAVMAATEALGLRVVSAWLSGVASYLPRVAVAVAIGALGMLAGGALRRVVASAASSAGLPSPARLGRLAQIAVLIGSALVAVEQLGIEISLLKTTLLIVLAALLGGGAIAFGLGGQHVVANILAAHFAQKVYQVGQIVRLEGLEGRIARITDLSIIVESEDGEVAVPAREFTEQRSSLVTRKKVPQ